MTCMEVIGRKIVLGLDKIDVIGSGMGEKGWWEVLMGLFLELAWPL